MFFSRQGRPTQERKLTALELYIHIPFCIRKCRYCDFLSWSGLLNGADAYIGALLAEADGLPSSVRDQEIESIYIGGGTPSLLQPSQLIRLMEGLRKRLNIPASIEFSCEANPGTLTDAFLEASVRCGVNRISVGMQSSFRHHLRTLGRIHTPQDVENSVSMIRQHGIGNLNLDLMFGLPGQTVSEWRDTLSCALSFAPEHLSCYGLIVEEGTPLAEDVSSGKLSLPDPEDERKMYDDALGILSGHHYHQYEISNFALPARECVHNLGYWRQIPYVGLGVGAASMYRDGRDRDVFCVRQKNPETFDGYLRMVDQQTWEIRETETVSPADGMFETMMLALRMNEGISEERFLRLHGKTVTSVYGSRLRKLADEGLVSHTGAVWRLTRRGMDIQNAVLVELMD